MGGRKRKLVEMKIFEIFTTARIVNNKIRVYFFKIDA